MFNLLYPEFVLSTSSPLALDSRDTIVPGGAMNDHTTHPEFVRKVLDLHKNRDFAYLDLGCSSGGLVEQFLDAEHPNKGAGFRIQAAGLEGSDYPLARLRQAWGRIPNSLFCCDISKPFYLCSKRVLEHTGLSPQLVPFRFNVVSAWEVVEHIPEERLATLFDNMLTHLMPDGLILLSVSSQDGYHHRTVKGRDWWFNFFDNQGLYNDAEAEKYISPDWPRGPREPRSFNVALRRKDMYPQ